SRPQCVAPTNRSRASSCAASTSASIVGVYPAASTSSPAANRSGSANSLTFGFKNPLNSPALRMTWRATQPSIQHCSSLEIPSPRTGSMPNPVAVCTTCGADAAPRPAHKAIINRCRRTILGRAITPATATVQHMHDTADDAAIIRPLDPAHIRRQVRFDPLPLLIAKPKQVPGHDPNPLPKTNQDRIVRAEKLMSSDPSRDICRPSGDCDRE